jgi:hypothetical protein
MEKREHVRFCKTAAGEFIATFGESSDDAPRERVRHSREPLEKTLRRVIREELGRASYGECESQFLSG